MQIVFDSFSIGADEVMVPWDSIDCAILKNCAGVSKKGIGAFHPVFSSIVDLQAQGTVIVELNAVIQGFIVHMINVPRSRSGQAEMQAAEVIHKGETGFSLSNPFEERTTSMRVASF